MQSLALPRPTSVFPAPLGSRAEQDDSLVKLRLKFSPSRLDQQSYPSPPMSEPQSPPRRATQTTESPRYSYPPAVGVPQRLDGPPSLPPTSTLFDPRSMLSVQNASQQRPLYPGDSSSRGQPLHYSAGPTLEHPYGNIPVPQSYAYGYATPGLPPYAANQHHEPMVQPAAMIAPPPSRPAKPARRTKAHVASACVNCKKAHLSCDVQRPCGRCVASGKQDTCKDVQHKKRGRPRLRDDREFSRLEDNSQAQRPAVGPVPSTVPEPFTQVPQFPSSHSQHSSESFRSHSGLSRPESHLAPQKPSSSIGSRAGAYTNVPAPSYAAGPVAAHQISPVAFLDLDLVIQKSNQEFQDLVGFIGDIRDRSLGDLLETQQTESLQRLRNELRDERDEREPTYMAPITPVGQNPMRSVLESVVFQDVDHVSHGFTERSMYLSFRLPTGQHQSFQVLIRLAKTSLYFVTLIVRTPPRTAVPSLLTQQLAPPTPARLLHSTSAPTSVPTKDVAALGRTPPATGSAPDSPFSAFSSVRTSLPTFSPGFYGSSPSYALSPNAGPEPSYFPPLQPPSGAYPSPYTRVPPRPTSVTSEPLRELNRPARLEGLHLPPIRTGPAPLGSPLNVESSTSTLPHESSRVRRRESSPHSDRHPDTPETGKRRRLNIHEVLE